MKKYILHIVVTAFLLTFCMSVLAQSNIKKAREAAADFEYAKAIALYNESFATTPPGISESREIALCYIKTGETVKAEEWLQKVISSGNSTAADLLNYARVLHSNGKYIDAVKQYQEYGLTEPNESGKVSKWVYSCQKSMEWLDGDSLIYDVVNLQNLNTESSEFGMIPFGEGFIFSSDRMLADKTYSKDDICGWTGNPYLKMYLVSGIDGQELNSQPAEIESLSHRYHDGQGVYDSQNKILYFTRTNSRKIKKPLNNDPTSWVERATEESSANKLEIYTARYDNGKWTDIKPFAYNNVAYSTGHPALSSDGKILYFMSDMPGGYGNADIYYCEHNYDGSWSLPLNAGSTINTEGNELFPFVDNKDNLYFSSDGHIGMGGLDIFVVKGSKASWTAPENLKAPVNSSKDDFSFCITYPKETSYISSNREGGKGKDDIYYFVPAPKPVLIGTTYERKKDSSLVLLKKVNVSKKPAGNVSADTLVSDYNGKFSTTVDYNKPTDFMILKNGLKFIPTTITPRRTQGDTIYADIITEAMRPLVLVGKVRAQLNDDTLVVLKNVNVKIENLEDNEVFNVSSNEKGAFMTPISVGKPYLLTMEKEGFYTAQNRITTKATSNDTIYIEIIADIIKNDTLTQSRITEMIRDSVNLIMVTKPYEIDKKIIVKNIYYDYDKWDIRPDAETELNRLVGILKNNPSINIELSSHTDSRGSFLYNDELSQKRAESAVAYITSKGIDARRLKAKGYGERKLFLKKCADGGNCTEEEHQMNRRTEFKVTSIRKQNK